MGYRSGRPRINDGLTNYQRWAKRNKERERAQSRLSQRVYRINNPRKIKDAHYKYRFGIGIDEMEALFQRQGLKCAVCGVAAPKSKVPWHLDHDHTTRKIRGVLCHFCNVAIGNAKENPAILRALANYLDFHATTTTATSNEGDPANGREAKPSGLE